MKATSASLQGIIWIVLTMATLLTCAEQALADATNCIPPPSGLVSWWRGEGNANDAVGGLNGTLSGGAGFGAGLVGQAFSLDGVTGYVQIGDRPELVMSNALTVEAWIFPTGSGSGPASEGIIINKEGEYEIDRTSDGTIRVAIKDPSSPFVWTVTPLVAPLNAWTHVALAYGNGVVEIYGNGSLVQTYNGPSTIGDELPAQNDFRIGGRQSISECFKGMIDEVAVYRRALSAVEIAAIHQAGSAGKCIEPSAPVIIGQTTNQTAFVGDSPGFLVTALGPSLSYQWTFSGTNISNGTNIVNATNATLVVTNAQFTNAGNYAVVVTNDHGSATSSLATLTVDPRPPCVAPPAGLVGWWRAEENPLDHTGVNDGTFIGNPTYGSGRVRQGFLFDGVDDSVQIGAKPELVMVNVFSVEAWIYPTGSGSGADGAGAIVSKEGEYILSRLGDGRIRWGVANVNPGWSWVVTPFVAPLNTWTHVALVYDNGVIRTYGNGSVVHTYSGSGVIGDSYPALNDFRIGGRQALSECFKGLMDELAVYNGALSTNDIQSIYTASAGGKCVVTIPPVIMVQPSPTNGFVGTNVTFKVIAGGSIPLSYQWRSNTTDMANATNSTLTLTNIQSSAAADYSVLVTNGAGSILSSNAALTVKFPPAVVRVGSTNVMAGGPLTVPVTLVANGNENSLGFSLNFSTQRLAFASATVGSGAAGAALLVNTSLVGTGRLGIAVALPQQFNFAPGTQEVVRVTFNAFPLLGATPSTNTIGFADQPLLRELSDAQLAALSAYYSNGAVSLAPTVFESDVWPRTNGNQVVSTTDWLEAGRFVARLDTPAASTNEFQRADCAPRALRGDGQMKVTDWVQAGRYVAGSDPLAAVGGPIAETAPTLAPPSGTRRLRVLGPNATQGLPTAASVILDAQGDENGAGFTLTFDPANFAYVSTALGAGGSGANLIVNSGQAGSGRLGVVLALPAGSAFAAGSRELVKVNLIAVAPAPGVFLLALTDQLVTRCVSDALANELAVSCLNTEVRVVPVNPSPPLAILLSDTNVVLTWPHWAGDFTLQMTEGSTGLSGVWTNAPGPPQINGDELSLTLPVVDETKFFRLFR